nr:LysE family transporter [Corynebacterium lactis]
MLTWTAILSLLGVHIIGMASPGPDLFLVLRLATKSRKHAMAAVAGISTGAAMWIALTVFGLAAVLAAIPWLMGAIQLVGGCYLAFMGFTLLRLGLATLRELHAGASPALGSAALKSPTATFRQGFFTNMSNPKIVLFLTAVLSQFIPVSAPVWVLVFCAALLIVSQIAFFCLIAFVVSTDAVVKRMVMAGPWIDSAAGIVFLILGIALITSGVESLVA